MSDYTGVTNQLGNAVGLPFSSFSVEEPGMIDLAFAADDLTRMNDMFWLDGIRRDSANWTDGDGAVRWSNGFNVYVRPFRAHVNGTIVFAPQTALAIDQETVSNRVDSVIIHRDYNLRTVNVMVLKGMPGSTTPPSLTYNAFGVVEYELARVNVNSGMVTLSQSDISDMRNPLLADFFNIRPTSADAGKIPMVDSIGGFGLSGVQAIRKAMGLGDTTEAVSVSAGGTGATTAADARTALGVDYTQSTAATGYYKLPGGLILQWGISTSMAAADRQTLTFPIAFPNACRRVIANIQNASTSRDDFIARTVSFTTTTATLTAEKSGDNMNGTRYIQYFAIGY